MHSQSIVIIGAGPVGSLLAALLAEHGCEVDVYERRPDMRNQTVAAGRSINLAVSARGLHALAQLGLDGAVLDCTVPMRGRRIHAANGTTELQMYGRTDADGGSKQVIHSMSRGGLNKILMTRAEQTGRVRIHCGMRLESYDFESKLATLVRESDQTTLCTEAPVIFGTDGSASQLRQAMQDRGQRQTLAPLDFGYKELTMSAAVGGQFTMDPNALHIWPRGRFMLIALPNPDGTFTCTMFLPHQSDGKTPSFADLNTDTAVTDFVAHQFPDVPVLMTDVVSQFAHAPLGHMATLRCEPWAHDAALLLGDAAHAIVPFFGQGLNAGFESCTAWLQQLTAEGLPETSEQWASAMARFWPQRKRETDAIAQLALENFVEMRDKVADRDFLLHRAVEQAVQGQLGDAYWTRYQLVSFSRVAYSEALRIGQLQAAIVQAACQGCTSAEQVDSAAVAATMRAQVLPQLAMLIAAANKRA